MKFTCNTAPLSTALDLGIINSNVSSYHKKSNIVQLTIKENKLVINVEAASIKTQISIKGSVEGQGPSRIFVGSLLLKQLISTIDADTVTLEFTDSGLVVTAGKSHFTLPKLVDGDELELDAPSEPYSEITAVAIDKDDWKFIKDNQLYALAISFIHPVYTRVWIGEQRDVLVGDYDNSLFTHSKKCKLGNTCLLSDTIINLFTTLPENSKITKAADDRNYIITADADSYSYISEFTPAYETDEGIGSYNSQIFLGMMQSAENGIQCKASIINKFLSQAELLSSSNEDSIHLTVENNVITLHDKQVDCSIEAAGTSESYELEFKLVFLKKIISNYGDTDITIRPFKKDGVVEGILINDSALTTLLAGVE